MSQAYLPPHDSNLLMELAPVKTGIFLQRKGRQKEMEPAWIPQKNPFSYPNEKLANKENLHKADKAQWSYLSP